ncbi:MAG: hypothetical protein M3015_08025 [Bacteroidota bacterium]|nr:hypothetical protein [Bacteroidota bacterium]
MFRLKKILLLLIPALVIFTSCKKLADRVTETQLEKYFETNVLNRDFIITLATDSTADFTTDYNGYVFVLLKTDYYHGPLKVTKGTNVYLGTWMANEDFGKLDISLPDMPPEFIFLTRSWRFTSKNLPTLKFAPWGSNAPIELNMYRQ